MPLSKFNKIKEIKLIKDIAKNNGYKTDMVDRLIRKQALMDKRIRYNTLQKEDKRYTSVTYVNKHTLKIGNLLNRKYKLTSAYKVNNTNRNRFYNNNIETLDTYDKSGVYQLTCQNNGCGSSYIGQTGRKFKYRYDEHKKGTRRDKPTAFSEHIYDKDHVFTNIKEDMRILHNMSKGRKLNTMESLEIHLDRISNNDNLNDHTLQRNNVLFTLCT